MPILTILDVGHGVCAVLQADHDVAVIDAGAGDTLLQFLEDRAIGQVDYLLLSHGDADHIAGAVELLSQTEIVVGRVLVNPDDRASIIWKDLRFAARDARQRGETQVQPSLSTNDGPIGVGGVELEINLLFGIRYD